MISILSSLSPLMSRAYNRRHLSHRLLLFSKYHFLRKQTCLRSLVQLTSKYKWHRGIAITGAGAATCALTYLGLKQHGQDDIWDQFKSCCHSVRDVIHQMQTTDAEGNDSEDFNVIDLFLKIGYEDEWLAFPFACLVQQEKKDYESSAFIKPNLVDLLSPWEQSSSDDPWVLLQLTKSSNFWVRQMGVACLANKVDWEAFKYRNVAQACDYRTVIGLSRYAQASDDFFFPQPKLCPSETNVFTDIQKLVKEMPVPDKTQRNIDFYRNLALQEEILFQKDPLTMDLLTHFYTLPGEEEKRVDQGLRYCLQALEAYTAEVPFAVLFVKHHGLAILQRLHEERKEKWIQMYVLIILNNLSHVAELGKDLVKTGWIHELRKWSKGKSITLSVMAETILANLDRDWISRDLYKNMILLHPTQRNSLPAKADIVLVHGLRGGAVKTWRQRDGKEKDKQGDVSDPEKCSDCWPKDWMSNELQDTRIISVGYNSTLHQWGDQYPYESDRRTLEGRSEELIQHLMKAGVGNRPIIWMGHSMGGLLIKEILWLAENNPSMKRILHNTKGILMYSVPHQGSSLVDTMMYAKYLLFPSVEVQEMSTYSTKLRELHDNFVRLVSSYFIPCLSFGESVKTDLGGPFPSVLLVSEESSDPGIGQFFSLPANHIDVCKPCNKNDPIYLNTLHFLQNILININQLSKHENDGGV